jgi:acetyltransferase-like isoleucine patch superfamily enzyme
VDKSKTPERFSKTPKRFSKTPKRFLEWGDLVLPWVIELVLLVASFQLAAATGLGFFASFLVFCAALGVLTLVALKIIRTFFPLKPGVFSISDKSRMFSVWNLYGFLLGTNFSLFYLNNLLPMIFRKIFYQLLGAKLGKGVLGIAGTIFDPSLVTLEEDVFIGYEANLSPHLIAVVASKKVLILGRIEIRKGVMIGGRTLILPGVTIGENSMVNALSLVPMNTHIPPNEVWGGNPAKRISSLTSKEGQDQPPA